MKGATVCSGIGAPEAAAPWIDWVWSSDIEDFPNAVRAVRFPHSVNLGDMTADDFVARAAEVGLPDVIVGGTPCQAFSVAGLRRSLDDDRGNLTLRFVRLCDAIDDLRRDAGLAPLWIVWENVPGVLSVADNAFGAFLGGLVGHDAAVEPPQGRGWTNAGVVSGPRRGAAWRVLDAQHFGVAQRRRRVFCVARGGAGDWSGADALLPVVESLRWHPAPRREAREGVAVSVVKGAAIGREPHNGPQHGEVLTDGSVYTLNCTEVHAVAQPVAAPLGAKKDGGWRGDLDNDTYVAHAPRAEGFDAAEDGTGRGTPIVPVSSLSNASFAEHGVDVCGTLRTENQHAVALAPAPYTIRADAMREDTAKTPSADAEGKVRLRDPGMGVYEDMAPTLDTGAAHGVVSFHPTQDPISSDDGTVHALGTGSKGGCATAAVAFDWQQGGAKSNSLRVWDNAGTVIKDRVQAVATTAAVRRLTPVECERLQGFPDNFTAITFRGKPAADGNRYRALGNSMAVPVMAWIIGRIREVSQ